MVLFELDTNWSRAAWIGFGVVLALGLLYVVYSFVGTFVFGVFIYYATRRVYRRVHRRVSRPSIAAGLSLLLLALPVLILLVYTIAIALQQIDVIVDTLSDASTQIPIDTYLDVLEPYVKISSIVEDPMSLLSSAGGIEALTGMLQSALDYIGVLTTGLLHLFIMLALAFYLLRDGPRLARWGSNFSDTHGVLDHYVREVDRSLDKVFYGNILNAIIAGTIGAISFSLLNLVAPDPVTIPYPALMGILAGVASLIPIVGMKLVYVPLGIYLAGVAFVNGDGWWFVALFFGVAFVIVDTIPDLIVRPYVSGGSLHVGSLMFAYIFGPLLFGWYGLFLGPIILVLVIHFVRIVLPELIAGTPIKPYSVDPSHLTGGSYEQAEGGTSGDPPGEPLHTEDGDLQPDSGD